MTTVFRSGDALMAFAPDLRIDPWNEELESLPGIPAAHSEETPSSAFSCRSLVPRHSEGSGHRRRVPFAGVS